MKLWRNSLVANHKGGAKIKWDNPKRKDIRNLVIYQDGMKPKTLACIIPFVRITLAIKKYQVLRECCIHESAIMVEKEREASSTPQSTQVGSAPTPPAAPIDSSGEAQQQSNEQAQEAETLNRVPKNPDRQVDKKQKTLTYEKKPEEDGDPVGKLKIDTFDQHECRMALAQMIIVDELPFRFVENEGFRLYSNKLQLKFVVPSRTTVARDCFDLFLMEKGKLKSILSSNSQMISITTDTWTSVQNLNYMCVTGHYIDDSWTLNKKILGFFLIADHKGETIRKALEKCLKDWGIAKICTITVDNPSSNNVAISYLVRRLSDWNCITILNGDFMHLRCCAHILNLIVNDGLKEVDSSIARIRASCKFVKSSPARLATFNRCVADANINFKSTVKLDVPTRWNCTYLMLETAEKYEKAFSRLEFDDSAFVSSLENEGGPPTSDDWGRARIFIKFLKDRLLNNMAKNMKSKLDKYWDGGDNMNYLLFVAVVLDPCNKLAYVEFCFRRMYGSNQCVSMLDKLRGILNKLFEYYQVLYPLPVDTGDSSCLSTDITSEGGGDDDDDGSWSSEFYSQVKKKQNDDKKNELERYLDDDVEFNYDGFHILKWWKSKTVKYPILSRIARDVLAIPISTVSSESAFSTGGRVLDPFRSSLNPTTVESLICAQNWLRTPKKEIDLRSSMDEIERIEAELVEIAKAQQV
ncbi:zinc finger BED domain-containing protein RICESLEEPER 2-like [Senna tora]|uniref:Zinc finger BED domain-containing protein RICESLEEPER 2-like n=1 Tax=Senna tora TaxID=362788 RepID=A0A834WGS9_9FABA|nr:zinc finger BED domain-containing protein RICESLEEPER 2-like [Senna tora]